MPFSSTLDPLTRWLRRRWWLVLAASLAVAFAGVVTAELLRIRADLDAGRAQLAGLDLRTVDDQGGIAVVVDRAADRIDAAEHRARTSPVLRLLRPIPVVGTQVEALRDMTEVAATLADAGRGTASRLQAALDEGSGAAARIEVARVAHEELDALAGTVAEIDLDTSAWLVPPLAHARHELDRQLRKARYDFERGGRLAEALEAFLTGPRRYLVLGGNNAEMRAVGIPTTSGIATIGGGAVEVGDFSAAINGIELPEPGVPVDPGYDAMYGWLEANRGYRTALASPNWPNAAAISAAITAANRYGPVDGVIYVDTVTLAYLLAVVGPVDVDGTTYEAATVAQQLLHDNYLDYPTVHERPARRELQSQVAQAAFDALNERDYSITKLAGTLNQMAQGRHLLGWSSDADENELWEAFGADGALPDDGLVVVSEELGASKLDWYVRMAVELTTEHHDDRIDVTLRITIANPEHGPSSPYIDGGGIYAEAGEYGSYLVVSVPEYAFNLASEPGFSRAGEEAPLYSAGKILRVPEGEARTEVITFQLPPDAFSLTIVPAGRLYPVQWTYRGTTFNDARTMVVDLDHHTVRPR